MASVGELKEALAIEHATSIEASQTAIAAIDTLLNFSMWVMGILAFVVALVALVGWSAIQRSATKAAENKADEKARQYVSSVEFLQMVEGVVAKEVRERWASTLIVSLDSQPASTDSDSAFGPLTKE